MSTQFKSDDISVDTKFIQYSPTDEKSDDFWATENTLKKHFVLLSKGLSIQNGSLTINNILEYDIAIE